MCVVSEVERRELGGRVGKGFDFGCVWIAKVLHSCLAPHKALGLMGPKKNTRPQINVYILPLLLPQLCCSLFIFHHSDISSCCVSLSFFSSTDIIVSVSVLLWADQDDDDKELATTASACVRVSRPSVGAS